MPSQLFVQQSSCTRLNHAARVPFRAFLFLKAPQRIASAVPCTLYYQKGSAFQERNKCSLSLQCRQ